MLSWIILKIRKLERGYLGGRDQALEFLEGRDTHVLLLNFLGTCDPILPSLYVNYYYQISWFGTSFYHIFTIFTRHCIIITALFILFQTDFKFQFHLKSFSPY